MANWKRVLPSALSVLAVILLSASLIRSADLNTASAVTSLGVVKDSSGTIVTIKGNGALDFEYFLVEGRNLVIDIFDTANEAWPTVWDVKSPYLRKVKIAEHLKPRKMVRVILELESAVDYKVQDKETSIVVSVGRPGGSSTAVTSRVPKVNMVLEMRYLPRSDKSRVEMETISKPKYTILESDDPRTVVIEISDTQLAPTARTSLDLSNLEREVERVSAREDARKGSPYVRVTATLRQATPIHVTAEDSKLILDFDHASETYPSATAAAGPEGEPRQPSQRINYGKKISLDLVDAEVNDILRLISEVAGINFVAGREVKGKVTMRLIDVPWETALDTVLMTNTPRLAQVPVSENIIRITTDDIIRQEAEMKMRQKEMEKKAREAERDLEPLLMKEIPISYAQLSQGGAIMNSDGSLLSILNQFTSDRVTTDGLLTADVRTNTIIVKDLPSNVAEIEKIIRKLDTPVPAVIVEARIVEVGSNAAESLGIRWNADFSADAAHGNALPVAFPNSVRIQGEQGTGSTEDGRFMVNLPATTPTSAIGLSFGHIANTFSLDLQLSAMEELGESKILSSPRLLVVQNEEAYINIGDKLPVPTTDAEGNRTVNFEPVGIVLKVTPQVTNDGRVFMDVSIEKSQRGENVPTTEGLMFSVNTREATTKVLIGNGETAVIGGILNQETTDNRGSVPALSKIPGLGWLFKNKDVSDRRAELMIFLTPKIVPLD